MNWLRLKFILNRFVLSKLKTMILSRKMIVIGENTIIDWRTDMKHPCNVSIGSNSLMKDSCKIIGNGRLKIGSSVIVSPNVLFICGSHVIDEGIPFHPIKLSKRDIIIANGVWIGERCTILGKVNVGEGAVISAASFVCKDVPAYAVVGGNPAKVLKYRDVLKYKDNLKNKRFWNMEVI